MQKEKGVSTLILVIIIIAGVVVAVGGVFAYQYFSTKTQPVVQTQQNQSNQTAQSSITVTSPNGGEQWVQGSTHSIIWNSQNITSSFKVSIGCSAGVNSTAFDINESVANKMNSYSWTVPSTMSLSASCRILVSGGSVSGQSNIFSIVAPTNQTAGWKTYTNTQYGFEFQYPNNLVIESASYSGKQAEWITVGSIDNKNLLSFDDFLSKDGPDGAFISKNIIDGKAAVIYTACCGIVAPQAWIYDGNIIYLIAVRGLGGGLGNPNSNEEKKAELELNQILSTFQFTK